MNRTQAIAVAVALVAVAGGCARQAPIDRDQWKAQLASAGAPSPDLERLEPLVRDSCDLSDEKLQYSVAAARDGDGDRGVEIMRVNFHNVCPDEEDRLYKAIAAVDDAGRDVDVACGKAASERTQKEQDLAEAMGCD